MKKPNPGNSSRCGQLRRLLRAGPIMMPGAFNALTVRMIERVGFPAVYVSGAGLSNAAVGVPDIGLLSLEEVAQLAGYIAAAVKVPVVCDADTGFGGPARAAATVRAFERAGLAGMHIEDQVDAKKCGHLPGKTLIPPAAMEKKIKAAAAARKDPDFLIIARTDAVAVEGFDPAVARAKRYLQAGADAIFPEALQSPRQFRDFADQVGGILLANMTEFGRTPLIEFSRLAALGYRMVIYPQTALRAVMKTEESILTDLRRLGTQKNWLARMQTRQELYDLLDYHP